jgi:hypothetical protein
LRLTREEAWRSAHARVYEHLRDTTKEGATPAFEDLAPLYQAIGHGCCAGRHEEALNDIYMWRICRVTPNYEPAFYSSKKLSAASSDLATKDEARRTAANIAKLPDLLTLGKAT